MQNNFATTRERDFNWHYFLAEAGRREGNRDYKYFGFLEEPPKYLPHEESTSSDHFGPKVNFPVTVPMTNECPISTATLCNIPKHMVTTTQQDYYGRTIGSNTGNTFLEKSCPCHSAPKEKNPKPQTTSYHDAMEILTTVGPVPLVKRCRAVPQWETTYGRDFVYDPVLKPVFPFPDFIWK